ncbi:MAG: plasmid mobilization protein [Gemmatimonadota bacterium]
MARRSEFLQIRVSTDQKAALKRRADRAGLDMSGYVLSRSLPHVGEVLGRIARALNRPASRKFALAELNDFLSSLGRSEFTAAVREAPAVDFRDPLIANYVAAMVEHSAAQRGLSSPAWTSATEPLEQPWFASELPSLRFHLLTSSPAPFRRRNLFLDATIGDRV